MAQVALARVLTNPVVSAPTLEEPYTPRLPTGF
jgi:hypothetical protein